MNPWSFVGSGLVRVETDLVRGPIDPALKKHFGFSVSDIQKRSRKGELILARHVYHFFIHKLIGVSSIVTGRLTGRDHATVLNSSNRVIQRYQTEPFFRERLIAFLNDCQSYRWNVNFINELKVII